MTTSHSPWFKFSFFMRSNEDTMIAMLKESFTERQNTYSHQLIPWSSQTLPKEYTIGWWTINQTKQDRFLLPSILFQDHYIFRYKLNLEQDFLFSQLKSGLYELAHKGSDNKLFLANAQYHLSEGYINTYIRHIRRALLKLQGKYISSSLVGQRPAAKASTNQELARDLSQEGMYYGIQMPHTFRSFLRGRFFQKLLSAPVRWISSYRGAPIVLRSHSYCLHQHSSLCFIFKYPLTNLPSFTSRLRDGARKKDNQRSGAPVWGKGSCQKTSAS